MILENRKFFKGNVEKRNDKSANYEQSDKVLFHLKIRTVPLLRGFFYYVLIFISSELI